MKYSLISSHNIDLDEPLIVGLCGPSGSGKSSLCNYLFRRLDFSYIDTDKFFKKNTSKYLTYENWEIPDALMIPELIKCVLQLKNRESTIIPSRRWTEVFDLIVNPSDLIILDGFLLFIIPELLYLIDLKIFLDIPYNMIYNRRRERNPSEDIDYVDNVVIPLAKKFRDIQLLNSNAILNGLDELPANANKIINLIKEHVKNKSLIIKSNLNEYI